MIRNGSFFSLHFLLADNYVDSRFLISMEYITNGEALVRPVREAFLMGFSYLMVQVTVHS